MDNGFDRACPSGNTMIDCYREPRTIPCGRCNGEGSVGWDTINDGYELMADELSHLIYKRKKQNNPVTTFREMLRVARIIKMEGADCPVCDGCGEVEE